MKRKTATETAESMAKRQRDISVSEFFLKNRHLLGFDSPRKAIMTAVKEAVDNSLDACEEAGILPEISVELRQTAEGRFVVTVQDNGPGIVRAQVPKVFAKLLYGSKFHRLRMSRGQQGIGISAAGMYGQLTTGAATIILSKTRNSPRAHRIAVQIDTRANKPAVLSDEEVDWRPEFPAEGPGQVPATSAHGTQVVIEMTAQYVRGRLSVDEYLKQCAVANPHLRLHFRTRLLKKEKNTEPVLEEGPWLTYSRAVKTLPPPVAAIQPHPHGVELGVLMQMLKDSSARTLKGALQEDFSRVSARVALEICEKAGLNPKANPTRVAHQEIEALYQAIQDTKLMRPPLDCLAPIGEEQIMAGLKKEFPADFYAAVTRAPEVYRGNPFLVEAGVAYAKPGQNSELGAEDPVRLMRCANRAPLLYMGGACAMTEAMENVNWKAYGLPQPKGGLPVGPAVFFVHIASVWVPFTSESKEAIAHYPEILRELTFALQEIGRQLSVFLSRRRRQAEADRKRSYIEKYIPHLALGLQDILALNDKQKTKIEHDLERMLERTHLEA
ncbi:MAG: DNA topoisomerase VI subunit B [Kiritimatiellae bacterium]|jgi:DNA topoisomerase-6 subunit B|nr:DNA topoisomerase VI subunit B [Kiritimatiellia bacterium]NLD90520.1 DNA topoisomerase VI subunit B [Lentisphaerota bacterium]HPC19659.1 DNA topoisomerase VI subunit B [Kiritimatiellia bacterium]HQN79613.1 DNA topoisomerase VI subunit B [Kiritimatiellia bacterium]HQQ61372.1 DNA topoisomerase VI subunit B [Kiritimatiellia bacterium]